MNIGIFANDPGGATGLAWGIFDPKAAIADALANRMNSGSTTVTGDIHEQIREIAGWWQAFYRQCVHDALLPPDRIWYVCEDFIYAPGVNYEGDSAKYSTAIIWGIEGYRMGMRDQWLAGGRGRKAEMPTMVLQSASQAKGYATSARLKEWGVWVRGKDHERSAWQHVAYFLKRANMQGL